MEFKLKGNDQDYLFEIHTNNQDLSRISNELRNELSKLPAR